MATPTKIDFFDSAVLEDTPEYGLVLRLSFGDTIKKVVSHLFNKELDVWFRETKYKRSLAQNRWLWGVAYKAIQVFHFRETGEKLTKEQVHAYCTQHPEILGNTVESKNIGGIEVLVVKGVSTSRLSTKQFNDYKEALQRFWGYRGCNIPDPIPKKLNKLSDYLQLEEQRKKNRLKL